jgi:hypothetical protein
VDLCIVQYFHRLAWRSSLSGILEAGRLIAEAKAALPHGEFMAMVENDLPFKPSTAQRHMKIASDERLSNAAHVQHLPPRLVEFRQAGNQLGNLQRLCRW